MKKLGRDTGGERSAGVSADMLREMLQQGKEPTPEEIGLPNGCDDAAVWANFLVSDLVSYTYLSAPPEAHLRLERDVNVLLAPTLLLQRLIRGAARGDATARVALQLLAHLFAQAHPLLRLGIGKLGKGLKDDADALDRRIEHSRVRLSVRRRVDALVASGLSRRAACRTVAKEMKEGYETVRSWADDP